MQPRVNVAAHLAELPDQPRLPGDFVQHVLPVDTLQDNRRTAIDLRRPVNLRNQRHDGPHRAHRRDLALHPCGGRGVTKQAKDTAAVPFVDFGLASLGDLPEL
jgi:hypothetical protein